MHDGGMGGVGAEPVYLVCGVCVGLRWVCLLRCGGGGKGGEADASTEGSCARTHQVRAVVRGVDGRDRPDLFGLHLMASSESKAIRHMQIHPYPYMRTNAPAPTHPVGAGVVPLEGALLEVVEQQPDSQPPEAVPDQVDRVVGVPLSFAGSGRGCLFYWLVPRLARSVTCTQAQAGIRPSVRPFDACLAQCTHK